MNEAWNSAAYTSGSYLHRMYLAKNTLFSSLHTTNDLSLVTNTLQKKVSDLQAKEDNLLSAYAKQFGNGDTTPEYGLELINKMLKGSDEALRGIIQSIKPLLEEGKQFDLSDTINRQKVEDAIIKYIEEQDNPEVRNASSQLSKLYEQIHKQMIEGINEITASTKGENSLMALEGFIHERLVNGIYMYNVLKTVSEMPDNERLQFEEWCYDIAVLSSFEGDSNANAKVGNRKSSYDMTIKVNIDDGFEDIPVQLKAKPRSKTPEIQLVQRMEIDNLLSKTVQDGIQKKAIKTALINQHYWGTKSYKKLVSEAGKANYYTPDSNLSSAHPTAIERFDKSQTLEALQPVLPIMENAVFYNLVTGVTEEIDTLLYVITDTRGYRIERSSNILLYMMGLKEREGETKRTVGKIKGLENITSSGRVKFKSTPIVDNSVESFYGDPGSPIMSQEEWWSRTEGIVNSTYEKMGITLSFNYGKM